MVLRMVRNGKKWNHILDIVLLFWPCFRIEMSLIWAVLSYIKLQYNLQAYIANLLGVTDVDS